MNKLRGALNGSGFGKGGANAPYAATQLSERVPVALIDPRTLQSLARLGSGSPLGDSEILPKGLLEPWQSDLVNRALAFAQSGTTLPQEMILELARDADRLLTSAG